jgi:hypothetical protein
VEEARCPFKILTDRPTEKRFLGRSGRRWEDSIIMDLEEIGVNTWIWIGSAQDR